MRQKDDDTIRELTQQLADLRENFQNFIYTISHDLSAPIRTVVAFSELLQKQADELLDEKSKHYLSFIVNGGEKAQSMLAGLLDYSRLNTRQKKPLLANTHHIVENCLKTLSEKIDATGAQIQIDELPPIHADEDQLYQLFLALIDNAIKFQPNGSVPTVHIHAEKSEDSDIGGWRFWVEDNGIGVEPRFAEEIFSVFRRLHREAEYPGIGMGLALAKRIVEQHGGIIGVSSNPGHATSFYFILPDAQTHNVHEVRQAG